MCPQVLRHLECLLQKGQQPHQALTGWQWLLHLQPLCRLDHLSVLLQLYGQQHTSFAKAYAARIRLLTLAPLCPVRACAVPSCHACVLQHQLGHYGGMMDEIDALKRDKNVLMLELVRLRQQQQVRQAAAYRNGMRYVLGGG